MISTREKLFSKVLRKIHALNTMACLFSHYNLLLDIPSKVTVGERFIYVFEQKIIFVLVRFAVTYFNIAKMAIYKKLLIF